MKILIVCKHFYPKINPRSFRAYELAKELALQGHEVKVYTAAGNFDYTQIEKNYGFKVASLGKMRFAKISNDDSQRINRFDILLNKTFGKLIHFPEVENALRIPQILQEENDYELLISLALPHPIHWGCALALKKNKNLAKTWIADCGDPLSGNKSVNYPPYFKYIENWAFDKADYITIPVKEAKPAYDEKHYHKLRIIPQGFKFDESDVSEIKNDFPTFAFAGSLFKNIRDPREFLNYLSSLDKNFKFIIYTQDQTLLHPFKETLKEKIEVRGLVQRDILLRDLRGMDFLINFEHEHKEQTPSKLIDYALTGRPILSIPSKNINRKLIDEFLDGKYDGKTRIDNIEDYDIKNVVKKFLALQEEDRKSK